MAARRKKASGKAKKAARKAPAKRRRGSGDLRGPKGRTGGGDVNFTEITIMPQGGASGASCKVNNGSWFNVPASGASRTDINVRTFAAKGADGAVWSTTVAPNQAISWAQVSVNMYGAVVGLSCTGESM